MADELSRLLNVEVIVGEDAKKLASELKEGEIMLLEMLDMKLEKKKMMKIYQKHLLL